MSSTEESVNPRRAQQLSWPCSVLVADNDAQSRARTVSQLRLAGYEVHTARSCEEALSVINAKRCPVVVTDWEMPGMDGLALCRALRLRDEEGYTYILMLTRRNGQNEILTGLSAGADDYLGKDASMEELLARVEVGRRITRLEHSLRASDEENRRLSVTDALTGAQNRRYLMNYLPRELERARRYSRPLAVLACDIDDFKRINDTFGHEAGDEVLMAFVARCLSCLRDSIDWVARAGGEEFIIVLPETPLAGASVVAEKLREILTLQPVPTVAGKLTVTVSIGVTALETAEDLARISVVELMRAADRCMYLSKRLGRDRATSISAAHVDSLTAIRPRAGKREIN